jgi:hypothetical protein
MTKLEKTKQCVLFLNEIMDEVPVVRTFAKSTMQFLNQRILYLSREEKKDKDKNSRNGNSLFLTRGIFDKIKKIENNNKIFIDPNEVFHKNCKKCQRLFCTAFDSKNTCNTCNLE